MDDFHYHSPVIQAAWVQAEEVQAAVLDVSYVNVKYHGVWFKMLRKLGSNVLDWLDSFVEDAKDSQGNYLKIWFHNKDIKPFQG